MSTTIQVLPRKFAYLVLDRVSGGDPGKVSQQQIDRFNQWLNQGNNRQQYYRIAQVDEAANHINGKG